MSEPLRIFVSHSHQDEAFVRDLAKALRRAGADVWYDEHNLGSGRLGPVIERELRTRLVFVPVLSPAALASRQVEDECRWADSRLRRDPTRTILPVLAAPLTDETALWPFLQDFKRVEAPGLQPLIPPAEAIRQTLLLLALTPKGQAPAPTAPQPTESAADLVTRGKALEHQDRHADALLLFERATQLDPSSFDAWFNLGYTLCQTEASATDRLAAFEQASALLPGDAAAWASKGAVLIEMERYEDALEALDRAISVNPDDPEFWITKGYVFNLMNHPEEALTAFKRAAILDPHTAPIWTRIASTLSRLHRHEEALAAFEHAILLDPTSAFAWIGKGFMLRRLGRPSEADAADARAKALRA